MCDHVGRLVVSEDRGVRIIFCERCGENFGEPMLWPHEDLVIRRTSPQGEVTTWLTIEGPAGFCRTKFPNGKNEVISQKLHGS